MTSIRFERRKKGRVGIPVDNKILTMLEREEVQLLVSPPTQAPGNRMQGSALNFKALEKKIQLTQLCEIAFFQHRVIAKNYHKIRPDETTDGKQLLLCVEDTRVLDLIRKPKPWQLFPKAQPLEQFWKFILWTLLTDMELKLRFNQLRIQKTDLTL